MNFRPYWFGNYELLSLLGVGGMAEVFLARTSGAQGFEKVVVVKRMLARLQQNDRFVHMFVEEAKLAVQLQHANIVQILDLDEHEGRPFIVMEYVHGSDLFEVIKKAAVAKSALPVDFGIHCIVEMLKGLGHAHNACGQDGQALNLLHRDVTPSNIFISYDGEVKLGDFGVAHSSGSVDTREVRGKLGYLAPEALQGKTLDARADVFSAGIVLWETLAGQRLFTGKSDAEILLKVRDVEAPPPSMHNPRVPPDLDRIAAKALHKDPDHRYDSAAAFEEDLADYLFARRLRWTQRRIADVMQAHFPDESKPLVLPPSTARNVVPENDDFDTFEDNTDRIVVAVTESEPTPSRPPGSQLDIQAWPESLESVIVEVEDVNNMVLSQATKRAREEQLLVHLRDGETLSLKIPELIRTLTYEPHTVSGVGVLGEWKLNVPELGRHLLWDHLCGFNDPSRPPDATGQLAKASLIRLVFELTLRRMTGLVTLEDGSGTRRRMLYLDKGYPVYVASDDPRDGAPALILEHKMLETSTIYRGLVQVIGDRMPFDRALVSVAGAAGQAHVERIFSAVIRSRLYTAFGWTHGRFRIYQNQAPELRLGFRVPPLIGILTRAVQRSNTLEELQAQLPLGSPRPAIIGEGRASHIAALHLRPPEMAVVEAINGKRNLPQIVQAVGAKSNKELLTVFSVLYVLSETQIVSLL